jgi:hypothetical protein
VGWLALDEEDVVRLHAEATDDDGVGVARQLLGQEHRLCH